LRESIPIIEWNRATMTVVDFEPLTVTVPLWEDPPGVFRVGNSRVLLELVLGAFKRGESPEGIVRSYRTLRLADVYAVISRYLANPAPFEEYLLQSEAQATAIRRQIEAAQRPGPTRDELLARARAKGMIP
jgi:uncharacterized protein (DUF433 family)